MVSKLGLASLVAVVFQSSAVRSPPIDLVLDTDFDQGFDLPAALVQEQPEDLPLCKSVALATYPGFCNTKASGYACYATEARYSPANQTDVVIDVQWACSVGMEAGDITTQNCLQRPWEYRVTTSNGTSVVEFVAHNVYKGACRLGGADEEEKEETVVSTTPAASGNASDAAAAAGEEPVAAPADEGEELEEEKETTVVSTADANSSNVSDAAAAAAGEEPGEEPTAAPASASAEEEEELEEEKEETVVSTAPAASGNASDAVAAGEEPAAAPAEEEEVELEEEKEETVVSTADANSSNASDAAAAAAEEEEEEPTPAPAPTPPNATNEPEPTPTPAPAPPAPLPNETSAAPEVVGAKANATAAPAPAGNTTKEEAKVSTTGAPSATTTGSARGLRAWTTPLVAALLLAAAGLGGSA